MRKAGFFTQRFNLVYEFSLVKMLSDLCYNLLRKPRAFS